MQLSRCGRRSSTSAPAPAHRHSQGAFRFVVHGEAIWWAPLRFEADTQLDLFTFNDHHIFEVLNLARTEIVELARR